jgi:hypothetical protein
MVMEYSGPWPETVHPLGRNAADYQVSAYPGFPVITDSRREVITLGKHRRKPRRQSRVVLVLQLGLVVLQLYLALVEGVDAITRLLDDLW